MIFLCAIIIYFMDEVFLFPVDWPRIIWIVWYRKMLCLWPSDERGSIFFCFSSGCGQFDNFYVRSLFSNAGHFLLVFFILSSFVCGGFCFFFAHFFSTSLAKFIIYLLLSKRTLIEWIHIESTKVYTALWDCCFFVLFEFVRIDLSGCAGTLALWPSQQKQSTCH